MLLPHILLEHLKPVPGIATNPLIFPILEMILRSSSSTTSSSSSTTTGRSSTKTDSSSTTASSSSTATGSNSSSGYALSAHSRKLQVLHMMATITHPDKCFFGGSALGAWPKLLPQLAAFVSCSKVYKATNWGWHELSFASKQLLQMGTHAFELQKKVAAVVPKRIREGNDLMQQRGRLTGGVGGSHKGEGQQRGQPAEEERKKQKQQQRQQQQHSRRVQQQQRNQRGAKQQVNQQQQQGMAAVAMGAGEGQQQQGTKDQHEQQGLEHKQQQSKEQKGPLWQQQQQQKKKEAGEQVFQLLGDISWVGMHLMNAACGALGNAALLAPQITAHMLNGVGPEVPEGFIPQDPDVLLEYDEVIDNALFMKARHLDQATKAREAAAAAAAGGDTEDAETVTQKYEQVRATLAPLVMAGVLVGGINIAAAVLRGKLSPDEATDILTTQLKSKLCSNLQGDHPGVGQENEGGTSCCHASRKVSSGAAAAKLWAESAEVAGITAAVAGALATTEAAGVAAPAGATAATEAAGEVIAAAAAPSAVSLKAASHTAQRPSLAAMVTTRLGSDAISDLSGLLLHALLTSAVAVESLVERFGVQRLQRCVEAEAQWLAEVVLPQRRLQLMACSLFLQHADAQCRGLWQPSLGEVLVEAATALQNVAQGSLGWAPSPGIIIDGGEGEGQVRHTWWPKGEGPGQEGVVLGLLRMAVGPALHRVPAGFCCYNTACSNLQGLSELGLMPAVARRFNCSGSSSSSGPGRSSSKKGGGVCGGCKRVWYCSRACQKQNLVKHKNMCSEFAVKGSRGQMTCVCIKAPAMPEGPNCTRCVNVMSFSDA